MRHVGTIEGTGLATDFVVEFAGLHVGDGLPGVSWPGRFADAPAGQLRQQCSEIVLWIRLGEEALI